MSRLPAFRKSLADLHSILADWYGKHARSFFWREPGTGTYVILLSEVMLQQTQTARVAEKLPRFLEQFPDLTSLAEAGNAEIIRAWQGMGYNNRALRLRDCARVIVESHAGKIPESPEALLALPGIGPYTASAILAFAYGRDIAVVDVNIQRVYSRVFWIMRTNTESAPQDAVRELAQQVFPPGRAGEWHQALMDLGATICTARNPQCGTCPLATMCKSAGRMREERKAKRPEPSFRGTPNRIWRGRIIEHLRGLDETEYIRESALLQALLGESLFPDCDNESRAWLHAVLGSLRRDGLISIQARGKSAEQVVQLANEKEAAAL